MKSFFFLFCLRNSAALFFSARPFFYSPNNIKLSQFFCYIDYSESFIILKTLMNSKRHNSQTTPYKTLFWWSFVAKQKKKNYWKKTRNFQDFSWRKKIVIKNRLKIKVQEINAEVLEVKYTFQKSGKPKYKNCIGCPME